MTWHMHLNIMDLIALVISCEALVELWKKAAPLQGIREWLIRITPLLYSQRQGTHLLGCPYCLSVYVAFAVGLACLYVDAALAWLAVYVLAIHRLSNWLHLVFSLVRDRQINIRLKRSRTMGGK